ncbi:hypothetical protein BSPLISOX_1213 [uncultured Gammaproteobacteria bacterium]|jgi:hypothetical protein|nr:hypothetical protein BSPLISOX_1213 [uncultured Gammaproteobacteria bacterium]
MKKLLLTLSFSVLLTARATEGVKPTPVPVDIIENPAVFKIK